jgi:putative nucleotidyltransferase with HDIG domain
MKTAVRPFVVLVALASALTLLGASWSVPGDDYAALRNGLAAFAILGFLSEASYLRLRVGVAETQSSIAFIPFIASTFLFDTGWAAALAGLAMVVVEYFVKKKSPIKVAFNVSQIVLTVTLTSWVYTSFLGVPSLTSFALKPLPIGAAVFTYFFINSTLVSIAVALGDGLPLTDAWRRIAGASLLYDLFSSPIGPLLAFMYVKLQLAGIVVLVAPLYFVRYIYQVNLQLEQVNRDLLELMVKAIEARDPYTSGHSLRVSYLARSIAKELGLGGRVVEQVATAALLHDVGKIHEDFEPLLKKEGKLDGTERALMQTHPSRSAELVSTISAFKGAIEAAVRHHHERFDGSGYPSGLAGDTIPIGARIVMVADTVDAMTTNRPYRSALMFDRVIGELEKFSGSQFDPAIVRVVVKSSAVREIVASRVAGQATGPALQVLTSPGRRADGVQPLVARDPRAARIER